MLTQTTATRLRATAPPRAGAVARDDGWLPRVTSRDAAAINALYRHRRPIPAQVAGAAVTIEVVAASAIAPHAPSFQLTLGGRGAMLRVSSELVDLCTRALVPTGFERLGAVEAAMLLELAWLGPIKVIEARTRTDIRFAERTEAGEPEGAIALHLLVRGLPSGNVAVTLGVDHETATAVARALDDFATPNAAVARLPIPVRICRDSVALTIGELRALRPGDVVLSDGPGRDAITAAIADHFQADLVRDAEGYRVASPLAISSTPSTGEWFMQQPIDAVRRPVEEAELEQLPVRVVFELGRLDLPLEEVRRLAPGYLLPLARPSESAVDIVANGRRIGHGSLVKIGDSVGVRVERLLADD